MTTKLQSISKRRDGFNSRLRDLVNYITEDARIFAQMLYERGATYEDLAKRKDVSRQAIQMKYPKEGEHEN